MHPSPSSAFIAQLFQIALAAHRAGKRAEAEQGYRQILAHNQHHADALHMLGIVYLEKGNRAEAETWMRQAIMQREDARFYVDLAILLQQCRRIDEAEQYFRQALTMKPDFVLAHYNFGHLLQEARRLPEAEAAYRRVLVLEPNFVDAHNNLGMVLMESNRPAEAEVCYRQAIALKPNFVDAHNNLGILLADDRRLREAEATYRQALTLRPDFADVHNNLGLVLKESRRFPEAEAAYQRALALHPDFAPAHTNLAILYKETQRWQEAERAYRQALALDPHLVNAHYNLGIMLLTQGRYAEAWPEFEYRWQTRNHDPKRKYPQALWQGYIDLTNKSILLYAEQGFGDSLQFLRYASLLAAQGATVYLTMPPALVSLARSCPGVAAVYDLNTPSDALPPCDFQCPLLSVPAACKTELSTIPATIPYLSSTPEKIAYWNEKLQNRTGLRVGLTWAGDPRKHMPGANALDQQRSMHFDQFRPLLQVPGVDFFSLQLGNDAKNQLQAAPQVIDFTHEIGNFEDTAALIANLDLIITVDTSVAHLSGAVGKPVWLLNRYNSCWRWLIAREDSPWYPSMRIFRQPSPGDWDSVMRLVVTALQERPDSSDQ